MKLRRLTVAAIVVPQQSNGKHRQSRLLAPETVIALVDPPAVSSITGKADELTVRYIEKPGTESIGFLAAHTPLSSVTLAKGLTYVPSDPHERITPWDRLRQHIAHSPGWNALGWLSRFGAQPRYVPLLHAVIRELGGRKPTSDDPIDTVTRTLQLIFKRKEISMKDIKTSRDMTPVSTAKKSDDTSKTKTKTKSKVAAAARDAEKPKSTTKAAVAKKVAKKTKEVPRLGSRGPRSRFAGMTIVRLKKEDPNTPNTKGAESWAVLKKGTTFEQFVKAGGRRHDLRNWVRNKHVKLVDKTA